MPALKEIHGQRPTRNDRIYLFMHEIEYLFYLATEATDRLRVTARKDKGEILEFVVQYETVVLGEWRPVVRYDTAHGFAHKDIIKANGEVVKQPLFFETYNMAFTYATLDLKMNWKQYKDNLEKEFRK
jgi:hypothetical protein